jgi:hypothetical protein
VKIAAALFFALTSALVCAACGSDGSVLDVEAGTYRETRRTDPNGHDITDPYAVFTVSTTDAGIALSYTGFELLPVDGGYRFEQATAQNGQCEGSGYYACYYKFDRWTATAPADGEIQVTSCHHEEQSGCSMSPLTCTPPERVLCDYPEVRDGVRVGN